MPRRPVLSPIRERQLVQLVADGHRDALGELLEAYQKRLYHVCLRMVGNRDDAAELTQEALTRAIEHIGKFKRDSRFGTWLTRIAMNLAISHLRRRQRRRTHSLDGSPTEPAGQSLAARIVSDGEPSPYQSVERREEQQRLAAAIGALDRALRSVLVLRDVQEMDYQEIAKVLGLPIGTVKSRLFRARVELRRRLGAEAGGKSDRPGRKVVDNAEI